LEGEKGKKSKAKGRKLPPRRRGKTRVRKKPNVPPKKGREGVGETRPKGGRKKKTAGEYTKGRQSRAKNGETPRKAPHYNGWGNRFYVHTQEKLRASEHGSRKAEALGFPWGKGCKSPFRGSTA